MITNLKRKKKAQITKLRLAGCVPTYPTDRQVKAIHNMSRYLHRTPEIPRTRTEAARLIDRLIKESTEKINDDKFRSWFYDVQHDDDPDFFDPANYEDNWFEDPDMGDRS